MSRVPRPALGVAAGLLLDRLLGEPPASLHPVAWFGRVMTRWESVVYADRRGPGVAYAVSGVALGVFAAASVRSTALTVAVCVAGRELRRVAAVVESHLLVSDLEQAKAALPSLVGRDPSTLDASGVSAAVIESLAENTVDAVLGPIVWGLLLGAPGAAAYRAANTMDAMVGHRGSRYGRFGWASARLDDAAGWVPARIFAALVALVRPHSAYRIAVLVRRDARAHPSPNAGVAETAVAAALRVELGGPLRYGPIEQDRPRLGDGPRPEPQDIAATMRLTDDVERAALILLLALWWLGHSRSAR
ncbi:MAG: CobD/CbiB family cobalamin biosynthesis protein [Ornithinimicrobium sp.]|uniref:CobD/CbiB family cobalamin biosynthesis protein n=1 Tax=Ornithinimicrobium sp. TaxID=1977084 RepID=UPI00182A5FAB|nr:cobalamin biosynthesis protein [Actinomycetota bacterium]